MKKALKRLMVLVLVFALTFSVKISTPVAAADEVQITILETSDLHGRLMNYDYATDSEAATGLVTVASVIEEQRAIDPELLLVDCGDTTQGNMVSEFRFDEIHPVVEALNFLDYDVWQLGNHEFNYEFENLEKNVALFDGEVLSANVYQADGTRYFNPYTIMDVKGVKVAIFGIIAPHVPRWESDPAHYNNMTFTSPMEETEKILEELEELDVDVTIGLVHYGEDGEHGTEGMYEVAKEYADRVDAFLIGHEHSVLCKYLVDGEWTDEYSEDAETVLVEPGTNGTNISKVVLTLEADGDDYKVTNTKAELIATDSYEPDAELAEVLEYVHTESIAMANTVVGKVSENFYDEIYWLPGIPYGAIEDGPVVDLINKVQLLNSGADVSLAALFDASANLTAGDFMLKDGVKVYKYDNTLMGVKVTGAQLKEIMEKQAGSFFNQYKEGDVTISFNPNIRLYAYDMFAGVDYKIDISKPVGERIVDVIYKGEPLEDDEELVLALNNYRYSGLVSAGLLFEEDLVYDSFATADIPAVRDMIADYIKKSGGATPECDNNWEIIGADLDDPQAELIYEMIRNGEITIPTSTDGRTSNVESVNAIALREAGILPALEPELVVYKVQAGDTLGKISKLTGCPVDELVEINKIENKNMIYVGQEILVHATELYVAYTEGKTYQVKSGDCLSAIAKAFGTTVEALALLNDIEDVNKIYAGQVIYVK